MKTEINYGLIDRAIATADEQNGATCYEHRIMDKHVRGFLRDESEAAFKASVQLLKDMAENDVKERISGQSANWALVWLKEILNLD